MTTTMTDLQTGRTFVFNEALPGRDAYEEALAQGFSGDRAAWLAHLRGFAFDPDAADWEVDRAYVPNTAVRHDHALWVAAVADTGTEPGTNPEVWVLLLDGAAAQDLADSLATALGYKEAAEAAASQATTILGQTEAAAQALAQSELVQLATLPVPEGWWDTRDRLLTGVSTRAILSSWWPVALVPALLARGTNAGAVFADTAGTTVCPVGGSVARVTDTSGAALHLTQATVSQQPRAARRPATGVRNRLIATAALATQSVAVPAGQHTLSFIGTGSVTLSGVATGTLTGTGTTDRVHLTVSASAGSLTLTVTGSVAEAQLETGNVATAYQAVGASRVDIIEAGVETVPCLAFDLIDDKLLSPVIPAGLTGQAFVAGAGGCYITDVTIPAGWAFNIGGTKGDWTGSPLYMLPEIAGASASPAPGLFDVILRGDGFSPAEIARLEQFYRARGGKGLLTPGPELLVNTAWQGGDLTGWASGSTLTATATAAEGELEIAATVANGRYVAAFPATPGALYLFSAEVRIVSGGGTAIVGVGDADTGAWRLSPPSTASASFERLSFVFRADAAQHYLTAGAYGGTTNVSRLRYPSVTRLTPSEDL